MVTLPSAAVESRCESARTRFAAAASGSDAPFTAKNTAPPTISATAASTPRVNFRLVLIPVRAGAFRFLRPLPPVLSGRREAGRVVAGIASPFHRNDVGDSWITAGGGGPAVWGLYP